MIIAGTEIGPDQPVRVVAEMSNAHNGKIETAMRLIREAHAAGADFVKFQAYTPDELVRLRGDGPAPDPWGAQGWAMRDLYAKARTPLNWFPALAAECEAVGVPWFASVFGPESLAVMESLGCPAYKIASLDRSNMDLAWMVVGTRKPIVVSTPDGNLYPAGFNGPDPYEESLTPGSGAGDVEFLYCPPGYPQKRIDLSFMAEVHLRGFSYHGTDPFVPAIAVAYGAWLIECHVQLDDEPSELEADVSLSMTQLRTMVGMARRVEALG